MLGKYKIGDIVLVTFYGEKTPSNVAIITEIYDEPWCIQYGIKFVLEKGPDFIIINENVGNIKIPESQIIGYAKSILTAPTKPIYDIDIYDIVVVDNNHQNHVGVIVGVRPKEMIVDIIYYDCYCGCFKPITTHIDNINKSCSVLVNKFMLEPMKKALIENAYNYIDLESFYSLLKGEKCK